MGRRVFMLFILCAVIPVSVLGIASYVTMATSLREQAFDRARATAKRTGLALFERLQDLKSSLKFSAPSFAAKSSGPRMMDERFLAMALISGGVRLHELGNLPPVPDLTARQQEHLNAGETIVTVSSDTSGAILMGQQVTFAGQPTGMIWAQVSDTIVDRVLAAESPTILGQSCIVHPDGSPIRCVGHETLLGNGPLAPALGSGPSGAFVWESDERYLAGFWSLFLDAEFATADWRIIHSEPEAEILAPLASFRRTFALAGVLALLIVGILSTGQIRRSLEPLMALREGTERIARLEFDAPVNVKSGDEFQDLAEAFNSMSERLRNQFVEAVRLNQVLAGTSDELRERQVRLTAIMDAAADAIVTVGAGGRIESFNRTAEQMFGRPEAAVVGLPVSDLFALAHGTGLDSLPAGTRQEVAGRRLDGAMFPGEVTFNEARAGDRTIYTVFVRDISERKRAAEERDSLESQLRHAHKMETIGTLAGGIAHDFNNILTPIIGYVDLMMHEDVPSTVKEDLGQVHQAAMRAKDLVQQILLFSRRGERKLSTIDVGSIVKESLKLLRASLPSTIEIRSSVAPQVELVLGDATQLHQVIMNLCTNAYHAMRDRGGVLEVRLDMSELDPRVAPLPRFDGRRAIRLVVRDNGSGMDAATLERLFEPFFTTKAAGEGTGLGMSIVHGIIAEHGGTVTVKSTPGVGTTFEILLPPAASDAKVGEAAAVAPQRHGEGKILVVDDDAVIAQLVARVLERLGYDVAHTTVPGEVPDMLSAAEPSFDLVITDQTMPGMTGLQLAERIQNWRPGFPVIMLSGYSELGGRRDPKELGLRELLVKPLELDALAAAVGRALGEDRLTAAMVGSASAEGQHG